MSALGQQSTVIPAESPKAPAAPDRPVRAQPALSQETLRWVRAMGTLGAIVLSYAVFNWESPDLLKYGAFLMVAIFSAGVPIDVPGASAPLSLNFLFVLFGTLELTRPETVLLATLMTIARCYSQSGRTRFALTIFLTGESALAAAVAHGVYHAQWLTAYQLDPSVRLAV